MCVPPPSHVLSEAEGTVTLKPVLSEVEGLSKRWLPALPGLYDHTPEPPLVKTVFVTGPMTVEPFTSTARFFAKTSAFCAGT